MARPRFRAWPLVLPFSVVAVILYRTAWLCDDAYITFRTIDNLSHGFGLTWNVGERVQTYSHPLWLFVLAALHTVSGELFYTSQYLSMAVTLLAIGFFFHGQTTRQARLFGVALLLLSKAFVDYSSSGLENPLSHLLVIVYLVVYFGDDVPGRRVLTLASLAGLAALTRLDAILIYLPSLAWELASAGWMRGSVTAAVAFLPLGAWELFSLYYYGFPFPNTAYAKLNVGLLGGLAQIRDGMTYLGNSFRTDPITLVTIGFVTTMAFSQRRRRELLIVVGVLAYLLYVVRIGGDYLSGRFISTPFVAAAFLTSRFLSASGREVRVPVISLLLCCGLFSPASPLYSLDANWTRRGYIEVRDRWAIHDERANFWPVASLVHARDRHPDRGSHPWAGPGRRLRQQAGRVQIVDAVGFSGYYAGPGIHIVDKWALGDALLARLPPAEGRIGHLTRVIPDGYIETLNESRNLIRDPNLAAYYERLHRIIAGDLWDLGRLQEIYRLNTGQYRGLLEAYAYFRGERFDRSLEVRNVTDLPVVSTYVWHKGNVREYLLDEASSRNRRYQIDWRISRDDALLVGNQELLRDTLTRLSDSGSFTIAVAFKESETAGPLQVYEHKYTFRTHAKQLEVLRAPVDDYTLDFGGGKWIVGKVDHVLRVREP